MVVDELYGWRILTPQLPDHWNDRQRAAHQHWTDREPLEAMNGPKCAYCGLRGIAARCEGCGAPKP